VRSWHDFIPARLEFKLQLVRENTPKRGSQPYSACPCGRVGDNSAMFSHIVVFWTDPANPNAADELLAGANQLLKNIPGVVQLHVGKMAPSHRPVVEQSYQVALNLIFPNRKAQDDYQVHPRHVEFVEKFVRRLVQKVVVYDFE
jgi:hypothetical protein